MPRHTLLSSFALCFLQVMYSQDKHSRPNVVETNNTSLELSLPVNQGYVIQIKPFSEGGEGISSRQITIPKIAGRTVLKHFFLSFCENIFKLGLSHTKNGPCIYLCTLRKELYPL